MTPFTMMLFMFTATPNWEREIAAIDAHSSTEGMGGCVGA